MTLNSNFRFIPIVFLLAAASCNSIKKGFSGNRSPHEKYGDALAAAGLQQTQLASQWFSAAAASLQKTAGIHLPYKETGFFAAEKPAAAGYSLPLQRGEILKVTVSTIPATGIQLFAELWQQSGANFNWLISADTLSHMLQYECKASGNYILRLQPELLKAVEYTLTIVTAPSLAFPVQETGKPKIISTWGVGRDNGARSHEGIDIGAAFGTQALAVANGTISRVTENNLGGKVIFLSPDDNNYSVYYAHLDKQIATAGQRVKAGETIGLVGNTGNAKNTVPHLHFGIYTNAGAINPQPFVDGSRVQPAPVTAGTENIGKAARASVSGELLTGPYAKAAKNGAFIKNQAVTIEGATASWYRVTLPDKRTGYIPGNAITDKPVQKLLIKDSARLLDEPFSGAPAKKWLPAGAAVSVFSEHNNFYYIQIDNLAGWIEKSGSLKL